MKAIGIGLIAFIVVILVGAAAGTVYYMSLQGATPQQLPNLSGSTTPQVQQLKGSTLYYSVSQGTISPSQLSKPSNTTPQFNVTYTGKALVTAKLGGVSVPVAVPLVVSNQKFGNDSRLQASLTGLPVVGNLNVSIVRIGGVTYICAPKDPLNKSAAQQCSKSSQANNTALTLFSLLQLIGSNMTLSVNNFYPSQYSQSPCVFVNSTITLGRSSSSLVGGTSQGSANLQSCIAPQNNLPLTLAFIFSAANQKNATVSSLTLALAQSASSSVVSDAAIRSLPAPVTN